MCEKVKYFPYIFLEESESYSVCMSSDTKAKYFHVKNDFQFYAVASFILKTLFF